MIMMMTTSPQNFMVSKQDENQPTVLCSPAATSIRDINELLSCWASLMSTTWSFMISIDPKRLARVSCFLPVACVRF